LLLTLILVHLANAHLALEHFDEAATVLDEGFSAVERTGERWAESELHRLRGQLLQQRGAMPGQAETCLRRAFDVAREQQAKSLELRAGTALAAHLQQQRRNREARALLSEVLAGWPMDFDSADLRDARALFAHLE
jgi:predicted ATPase